MRGHQAPGQGSNRDQQSLPVKRTLPRRATDRIEDWGAWLLISLGLLGVVLAVSIGARVHTDMRDRAEAERTTRVPVTAVLLEDASSPRAATEVDSGSRVEVLVRWVGEDGVERVAPTQVLPPMSKGDAVTVWVDGDHKLVTPPMGPAQATLAAVVVAGLVLSAIGAVLALAWNVLRSWTFARNLAAWEREWRRVEPVWSGRTRGGSMS